MLERAAIYLIAAVVLASVLASALPRITSSLVALGLLVLIARWVWWYTR
jgi:L-lactate permease